MKLLSLNEGRFMDTATKTEGRAKPWNKGKLLAWKHDRGRKLPLESPAFQPLCKGPGHVQCAHRERACRLRNVRRALLLASQTY
jgi:hypothetical protein